MICDLFLRNQLETIPEKACLLPFVSPYRSGTTSTGHGLDLRTPVLMLPMNAL